MVIRLILTNHAKQRLLERGIAEAHLLRVVKDPDSMKVSFRGNVKIIKKVRSKTLEIVCTRKGDLFVIITAYYL